MGTSLNDCSSGRRFLQESQTTPSFVTKIQEAISSINQALLDANIVFEATVTPYFDIETLSVGVNVELSATIQQTASDMLGLFTDFLQNTTSPTTADPNFSKMGVGTSGDPVTIIDMNSLLSDTVFGAGLDVTFGIQVSMNEIQSLISGGSTIAQALGQGITLKLDTWGASAFLIVDPIEVGITLFGKTISIRDSHFALSVDLRSKGPFASPVSNLESADTSNLIPDLMVPLSSEIMFDVPVGSIVISPIMSAVTTDLIDADIVLDFDVDLSTFLNASAFGSFTIGSILQSATDILNAIANLEGPTLNAGKTTPSALNELFSIVGELQDLSGTLQTYIGLAGQGKEMLSLS
jgi:hypothetical protein